MLLCIRVGPAMHIFSNPWLKKHTQKTLNPPRAALINRNKLTALLKHPFRLLSVTADDTTQRRQTKKKSLIGRYALNIFWACSVLWQTGCTEGSSPLSPSHTHSLRRPRCGAERSAAICESIAIAVRQQKPRLEGPRGILINGTEMPVNSCKAPAHWEIS